MIPALIALIALPFVIFRSIMEPVAVALGTPTVRLPIFLQNLGDVIRLLENPFRDSAFGSQVSFVVTTGTCDVGNI